MSVERVSLHDIAPRLAQAREVEKWNVWCAGDEGTIRDGDRWAETVDAKHGVKRCPKCGDIVDRYVIRQRILYGVNRNRIGRIETERGRHCHHVWWSRHT